MTATADAADDAISIVTAFFDIGKEGSSVDAYCRRFARLAALANELVIYTSPDLVPKIEALCSARRDGSTTIVPFALASLLPERRAAIRRIQQDPAFRQRLNPAQANNPEYSSPDYVLLTTLKPVFVTHAVQHKLVRHMLVAWLDFGYCIDDTVAGGCLEWRYPFDPDSIHLFVASLYPAEVSIDYLVLNNAVLVAGGAVVAGQALWPRLAELTSLALDMLMQRGMVDDEQSLFVMASLAQPDLFTRHLLPGKDWRPVLRHFNRAAP